jgi:hypothetical protein
MGLIRRPLPVKLIIGFIFKDPTVLSKAENFLKRRFGQTDLESQILPFTYTDYYERELGKPLEKKFISFKKLIPPESLPKIKAITNEIEKKFSAQGRRSINIDPGYVDLSKLVLASTKDFSHRIYVGRGIYSEVTLVYQDKTFNPKEWTYPDYRSPEYIAIFNKIRQLYAEQIRKQ